MAVEVYLPKMSDHMETGRILHWHRKEGDQVERGQVLLEIETDKAIGELEAPASGLLKGVRVQEGMEVPVGEVIAYIARADEEVPALPPFGGGIPALPARESVTTRPQVAFNNEVKVTPVARRMAKDLGVDLGKVRGTGPGGTIRDEDVREYAAARSLAPESPTVGPSPSSISIPVPTSTGPIPGTETISLSKVQLITGQRMSASFQTAPHFYLQVAVDMTRSLELLDQIRKRNEVDAGERITMTVLLVKAVCIAIKKVPRVNAAFEKDHLRVSSEINIGVAIGSEEGLVVPVINNADRRTLGEINQELRQFQAKAKEIRFTPGDLSGGTFTISNLGMYGVDVFQAIINPPQSSILAVGQVIKTPVGMPDDSIALRPMMNLVLSVDHRVLDGMQAAKFLAEVRSLLETPGQML